MLIEKLSPHICKNNFRNQILNKIFYINQFSFYLKCNKICFNKSFFLNFKINQLNILNEFMLMF